MPESIAAEREFIRERSNELEFELMNIADLREVLLFEVIF
jgi:hypothetical protein